jgi:hypothetical protein
MQKRKKKNHEKRFSCSKIHSFFQSKSVLGHVTEVKQIFLALMSRLGMICHEAGSFIA